MHDSAAIATLETRLENLTTSISNLTQSVERNNEKLERLSVLEVSHNNAEKAIERAFGAVEKVEALLAAHVQANNDKHAMYDKWIWVAVGFCSAISIMWTIVGYRMNALIDDQMRAVTEMRMHIHDDKIKDASDLNRIIQNGKAPNGIPIP